MNRSFQWWREVSIIELRLNQPCENDRRERVSAFSLERPTHELYYLSLRILARLGPRGSSCSIRRWGGRDSFESPYSFRDPSILSIYLHHTRIGKGAASKIRGLSEYWYAQSKIFSILLRPSPRIWWSYQQTLRRSRCCMGKWRDSEPSHDDRQWLCKAWTDDATLA